MKKMSVLHLTVSLAISSIMVIVIMLIRKVFKNKLSSKLQYNLWFLLIITLLLPYIPTKLIKCRTILPENRKNVSVKFNSTNERLDLSDKVYTMHKLTISAYRNPLTVIN